MSVNRNKGFYKQYAISSYINKINPEDEGIAKRYYHQKREHDKIHLIKDKLNKDVAYIERIEKSMQSNLQKKKRELQYTKEVNNRILNDYRRRELFQQYKAKTIQNKQHNAQVIKSQSVRKIQEARDILLQNKRSLASLHKNQNDKIKEMKSLSLAKQWDSNRSRVTSIQKFKKNVKQSTNKFYQTRNSSAMSSYHKRIQSYQKFQAYDSQKIKELEEKKMNLSKQYQRDKDKCDEISQEIEKIKLQCKLESSLVRSRLKSSSSESLRARSNHSSKLVKNSSVVQAAFH